MDWYENLYIGKTAEKKKEAVIRSLEQGKAPLDIWLITLPAGRGSQLELLPALNLKFWHGKKACPRIIGFACTREEALELLREIVQDVLDQTGNTDLRSYFCGPQGE